MKIFEWISNKILFFASLFLLAFIPLYPKLPVLDVTHTWVYVRVEDFIVLFVLLIWIILMVLKKVTLKTPLTISIILFWIVGAVATIHGILLIFPTLQNVFPNVAFLSYIRRIEYISLFFVGYWGIKDKKVIIYVVSVLSITLLLVSLYGLGQKFLGFNAYLTMNEEFAKGVGVRLSSLSRISSTFGGHYDLAAYIVLIIPLLSSMIFGFRNWLIKIFLLLTISLSFIVLFMTVSRVSFVVLLFSMILILFMHKRKFAVFAIISLFFIVFGFLSFSNSLLDRFGNTIKEVDVLVDSEGQAVGNIKEISTENFKDKIIKIRNASSKSDVDATIGSQNENEGTSSDEILLASQIPSRVSLLVQPNAPTGENLPQGTGYVNLALTPVSQKINRFFYIQSKYDDPSFQEIIAIDGNFLIKRARAYDLSFTTRFQGEWPKTIDIFKKDILFGGGYSATGLAVDNNYLRILGEVGLLGFISFFSILLMAGIYIKRILPDVDSYAVRSFVYGFIAGSFGLALNAVFIDVFEASKIAFTYWLLLGITIGTLSLYQKKQIDFYKEFMQAIGSSHAIVVYLFTAVTVGFSGILNYSFVADDFTWFKWASNCSNNIAEKCSIIPTILSYFTDAQGFFYRPGTKVYFLLMYSGVWLNQEVYHMVSIFLHFIVVVLIFLISKKILKNFSLSVFVSFLFVILSGYYEAIFWVSSTGHLFNAMFILLSLLFFIYWSEKKRNIYFILSFTSVIFSLLFHELGLVAPLIVLLYVFVFKRNFNLRELFKDKSLILFFPILPYLIIRLFAQSHWFNGDYSYNLLKLPYNFIGNAIGYFMLQFFGLASLPIYEKIRNISRENLILISLIFIIGIFAIILIYKTIIKNLEKEEKKIVIFGFLFFILSLLPFLGLGNITSRYSYLASFGFALLFVIFLKKIFEYLNNINGRNISIAITLVIVSIFSLMHIIQLQKLQGDWKNAGEKTQKFVVSLDQYYTNAWRNTPMNFYFVNVPIRLGDAWVFPVGLKDAVWFVSQNDQIKIYQSSSLQEALNGIKNSKTDKVFVFDDSGIVIEKKNPKIQE